MHMFVVLLNGCLGCFVLLSVVVMFSFVGVSQVTGWEGWRVFSTCQ